MRIIVGVLIIAVCTLFYLSIKNSATIAQQQIIIDRQTQVLESEHNAMLHLTDPQVISDRIFEMYEKGLKQCTN